MLSHMLSNLGVIQLTLPNKLLEEYNTHQETVQGKKKKQCRATISVSTNGELHMSKKLLKTSCQ